MSKRILDVGNCRPDHASVRALLESMGFSVEQSHTTEEALARLKSEAFDLVLVNRKLDHDYSDGTELVAQMKSDPGLAGVPVMLISNYADAQQEAVALGAAYGFGKLELARQGTQERILRALGLKDSAA